MNAPTPLAELKNCETLFERGLNELNLTMSAVQRGQLMQFLALLYKWNQRINLTSVRSPLLMVSRHLLDSLAVAPYLNGENIIDVGTGGGFPGIPLSVYYPDKAFVLLDTHQKKQLFVTQGVNLLALKNVQCVCSLVQAYQPEQKFSTILTRAFAPIEKMIPLTAHLLKSNGRFLAMLGRATEEQLKLPPGYEMENLISLKVPGEKAQRHLAVVRALTP